MVIAISLIRVDSENLYVDYGSGQHRKGLMLSSVDFSSREKNAIVGFHAFRLRMSPYSLGKERQYAGK